MILNKNMRLTPTVNPNYDMKETPQELINLLVKCIFDSFIICDDNIIGVIDKNEEIYDGKDGFIYGTILSNVDMDEFKWCNAEFSLDKERNIKRISGIFYCKREGE